MSVLREWDTVESRHTPGNPPLWVAVRGSMVATKDGEWEYEPIPSSRTQAFTKRTRFRSPNEALAAYDRARNPSDPHTSTDE